MLSFGFVNSPLAINVFLLNIEFLTHSIPWTLYLCNLQVPYLILNIVDNPPLFGLLKILQKILRSLHANENKPQKICKQTKNRVV